jgi:hypothetical protein
MRLERYKNFLSLEECTELNAWVDEATAKNWLGAGINARGEPYNSDKRVTSRFYGHLFEYPQLVLDISKRVRLFYDVDSYELIAGHGRDGVVVSNTFNTGDVYSHKDPQSAANGFSALRLNILTRKPTSGGVLHIEDQPIELEVGELHCYLASEFTHGVSTVGGDVPRVLWMFGAYVPMQAWESGAIKARAN